ncbi:MAG TPA: serine hydrolase [Solirubrobacteraceae bacterium]|nr:serine hydrolase [Solirubrobacteraceae bacterium]
MPSNPLTTAAMRRYLGARTGTVAVAVEDLDDPTTRGDTVNDSYKEWLLNPGARVQTASIVKVDILETLLHSAAGPLTGSATAVADGMIEQSDNDDATALWNVAGGAAGIGAYNRLAGLTQTTPNIPGYWGETLTSAADQIRLLGQLVMPSRLLSAEARRYGLGLMENIAPGQKWGVTSGVPADVTVALKNGWVPLTDDSDWEINSIGWVHGGGRDYLIAVLTAHDPSEQYGIDTVDRVSSLIFADLRR